MRIVVLILGVTIAAFGFYACSETPSHVPATDLRAAMQERMTDIKRIKAALEAGKPLVEHPLTSFAGLPHSEFVDGVEEYQDALAGFDQLYAGLFTAADPQAHFKIIVTSCESCHMQICPGPLRGIRNLNQNALNQLTNGTGNVPSEVTTPPNPN